MAYFQTKNPDLGKIWRVLQYLEDVGILQGHLVNFAVFLVYRVPFWYAVPRKIWQPWLEFFVLFLRLPLTHRFFSTTLMHVYMYVGMYVHVVQLL
jgi:hypothetical protein